MAGGNQEPPTWLETSGKAAARLVPYVGSSISVVLEDVLARHRSRGMDVVQDIADHLPDADSLMSRLAANEEVELIFVEGVEIAIRSGFAAKRRLLAKVVARAVNDDAKIEESQLIVTALRDLDAPHIRALARLRTVQNEAEASKDPGDQNKSAHDRVTGAVASASYKEPVPIRSTLVRTGVVFPATVVGSGVVIASLTDFGEKLLADLDSVEAWS